MVSRNTVVSMTTARMRCCWRRRRALPALPFMLRFDILAMVITDDGDE